VQCPSAVKVGSIDHEEGIVDVQRLGLVIAFSLAAAPAAAEVYIDDLGREVEIDGIVERAVLFNRYELEFVRAVGAGDTVVGIPESIARDTATYWPEYAEAAVVGANMQSPNYEAIVALDPDVVIMSRFGPYEEAIAQLAVFEIPLLVVTGADSTLHEENVDLIGRVFGRSERAAELNGFYRHYRDLLAERLEGVEPVRVYFEETTDYGTVLEGSGWHDMVAIAGGVNVFGDMDISQRPTAAGNVNNHAIDPEEVMARFPDFVVKLQRSTYSAQDEDARDLYPQHWSALANRIDVLGTPAGEAGAVYLIDYYMAGGVSKVTGALQLAKWFHPELFADIDPEAVMREWIEDYQGVPFRDGLSYGGPEAIR